MLEKLGKRLGALQRGLREADGAALVGELPGTGAGSAPGSLRIVIADGDELELLEEQLLIETGSPGGYQVDAAADRGARGGRRRGAARRGRGARAGARH